MARKKKKRASTRRKGRPAKVRRRKSGRPGGGAGRREEVRGSGVYPASGRLRPGEAPIRTLASWGQGSRGAAGYEDAGSSELVHTEPSTPRPRRRKVRVRRPSPEEPKATPGKPLLLPR
jgi:hypothetical protein